MQELNKKKQNCKFSVLAPLLLDTSWFVEPAICTQYVFILIKPQLYVEYPENTYGLEIHPDKPHKTITVTIFFFHVGLIFGLYPRYTIIGFN